MFDKLIVRRVLETPGVYAWFQKTVAKKNGRKNFLEEYLGDVKGKRILDLGCGTADVLEYIEGEKLYVGIDYNEQYIKNNKKKYSERETCKFYHMDLNDYAKRESDKFDIVMMIGVMHHIDDLELDEAMKSIKRIIEDGGLFISLDACYSKAMNPIARLLCMLDRGRYVRYVEDYVKTQEKYWTDVKYYIRTDTLRFLPYSVIIFVNRDSIIKE